MGCIFAVAPILGDDGYPVNQLTNCVAPLTPENWGNVSPHLPARPKWITPLDLLDLAAHATYDPIPSSYAGMLPHSPQRTRATVLVFGFPPLSS